jgi:hypothetical protein
VLDYEVFAVPYAEMERGEPMVSTREDLTMVRRFLLGMALTGGALVPAMSAAEAAVIPPVPASHCMAQGGQVIPLSTTVLECRGGVLDGAPVYSVQSSYFQPFTPVR